MPRILSRRFFTITFACADGTQETKHVSAPSRRRAVEYAAQLARQRGWRVVTIEAGVAAPARITVVE